MLLSARFDANDELGDAVVGELPIDGDGEVDLGDGGGDVSLGCRSGGEAGVRHDVGLFVLLGGMGLLWRAARYCRPGGRCPSCLEGIDTTTEVVMIVISFA